MTDKDPREPVHSDSWRRRAMAHKADELSRLAAGAGVVLPARRCNAHGCQERLPRVRIEPGRIVAFEVRAPFRVVGNKLVLEASYSALHPLAVFRPRGGRISISCPQGHANPVDLRLLRGTTQA